MKIDYNILFFPEREKGKNDEVLSDGKLRMRIRYNRLTVNFNVGYRIEHEKWSREVQICKPNTTHGKKKVAANIINKEINRMRNLAIKIFSEFEFNNDIPTLSEFRDLFNAKNAEALKKPIRNSRKTNNFYKVYDDFVKTQSIKNSWTNGTKEKFAALKNHLLEFDEKLSFKSIDHNKLTDLMMFFIETRDMRNTTIKKQFEYLTWFLRWTTEFGHNNNDSFKTFKVKLKTAKKPIIFLDVDELKQLENFEIPSNRESLEQIRDVFLFLCYSGLRFSDVKKLTRADFYHNEMNVLTLKTNDNLSIELNNFSKRILDKYKGVEFKGAKVLPVKSNQKTNDYLKELAKMVGFDRPIRTSYYKGNKRYDKIYPKWKLISTHAGRRTFICTALSLGVPPHVVMQWSGHSDYDSMKPYIAVTNKTKAKEMEKFDNLFN